jgi:hypothetical protein
MQTVIVSSHMSQVLLQSSFPPFPWTHFSLSLQKHDANLISQVHRGKRRARLWGFSRDHNPPLHLGPSSGPAQLFSIFLIVTVDPKSQAVHTCPPQRQCYVGRDRKATGSLASLSVSHLPPAPLQAGIKIQQACTNNSPPDLVIAHSWHNFLSSCLPDFIAVWEGHPCLMIWLIFISHIHVDALWFQYLAFMWVPMPLG